MHTLDIRALEEHLREAESGWGETKLSVSTCLVAVFNSILFTISSATESLNKHLTIPAFLTKQWECGLFITCSGHELVTSTFFWRAQNIFAGIIKKVLYCLV